MTKFLFWNVNNKDSVAHVASLAHTYRVDVVMLAECQADAGDLLLALNTNSTRDYNYSPKIGCEKITIFTSFPSEFIPPLYETDRLTIRHLRLPGLTDLLLAITHLPSKLYWDEGSQAPECFELSRALRQAESLVGHARTVLVGDLNMNPFEDGVIDAAGLHGVMTRDVAKKGARKVQSRHYPFFYNPMWGLFGDHTRGPAGTFFYRSAQHKVFFWNMFDQVLIRPDLLAVFNNDELLIPESTGKRSLLSGNGHPDGAISDHLPIIFALDL
ncbi:MAG: endonuclease/exonuclease/phosphatase family protein [Chloroflexi bacterium]|nr:endonuclease/exonuclease/phosphatase family protein [Chloroflexota bacterium]